ncbi:beta-1,4-N-acetylgalactosaminyltransferase bre-4 [Athalia rosae]|uniref:beta-1,4-N-acetylgalactosaminyltransferase bre-4 n=1 Tax=Athalia rosae TaxID=37344 RepID=UPI002033F3DD|nr:beta-1,4-N-acetylgalactosaminyltransferase bre-4 [Athalia rosae]
MIPKGVVSQISEHIRSLSIAIATILALCYCLHPGRFASHYSHIKTEDIFEELDKTWPPGNDSCPFNIRGRKSLSYLLYPIDNAQENPAALAKQLGISPGGQWRPLNCRPLFNVAIILPYRNRHAQLTTFISFIHPFLQAQNLDYRIFIVEQTEGREFNRAKLFNVGFSEAIKSSDFHCFIFQDIDLIPQNLNNIYACTKMPRHMSSSVNTFRYNLPYNGLFGGAIALTREHFQRANGFSNVFYGWGGEDDDFYSRLQTRGLKVCRFGPDVAQYYMLIHAKEPPSSARFVNLETGARRYDTDGISNLEYRVLDHQLRPLYTWILAEI